MNSSRPHIVTIKLIATIAFYLLLSSSLSGQNRAEDLARGYISVANANWHNDIATAQEAARNAFVLIPKLDKSGLKADAFAQYGISFYSSQKYDSAIKYYQKALFTAGEQDPQRVTFIAYLCSAYDKQGRFKEIFDIIDSEINSQTNVKNNPALLNLYLKKLSAALQVGLTEEAEEILSEIEEEIQEQDTVPDFNRYLFLKSKYYQNIASFQKSDSIFLSLVEHYDTINNKMDQAETFLLLGHNAMEVSRYKESSEYLIQAEAIYDSLNYTFGKAKVDLFTGTLLSWMQRYNEASIYIFKALKLFEENRSQNEIQMAYYELGWIFYSTELEERAKDFLFKAIKIARSIQNLKYLGREYNALGSLYSDLGEYDSALLYYDSSIYYNKLTKDIKELSASKFNKAYVLEMLGKTDEALNIYHESYKIDLKLQNITGLIEGDLILGQYYLKAQITDSAMHYFDLGEKRASDLGEKYLLLKILQSQADLYSQINNHQLSSQYLRRALETQKQLAEETKTLELATLETTYNVKNKEKELSLLNLQRANNEQIIALNQKTIESQQDTLIVLAVGIFVLLILSYTIFRYLKIRTKTNHQLKELNYEIQEKQEEIMAQSEELKEANDQVHEMNQYLEKRVKDRTAALEKALAELDHFFYRASHDFRGPLTTLMGLVGISKGYDLPDETSKLFEKVNITVKKLDSMVKKLQAVSFLGDFENLKAPKAIEVESEIKRVAKAAINSKTADGFTQSCDIEIHSSVEKIIFYPVILEICLSNLIENSLIFNTSDIIKLQINAKLKNEDLILSIQDNGVGISRDQQEEIFNMFKRTSQTSTGNGLGLYIVKKAIELLDGNIKLESDTRTGSTFTLSFSLKGIEQSTEDPYSKVYIPS